MQTKTKPASAKSKSKTKSMKKLYRIKKEHKIAGVCTGLSEYLEVDAVFFRLFFVVMVCMGGLGFLLYGVMWLLVPEKSRAKAPAPGSMRLYISNKDKKIYGVCGGLGEYFDLDPIIFRIAFIVGAFMGGVGILAYIIMCFIVPQKNSRRSKS